MSQAMKPQTICTAFLSTYGMNMVYLAYNCFVTHKQDTPYVYMTLAMAGVIVFLNVNGMGEDKKKA